MKIYLLTILLLVSTIRCFSQGSPFTPGNIVTYRVGDGITPLTTATAPVFLDEYTVTGTLVQSIPMPIAVNGANKMLTMVGVSGETGLTLSADGRYLVLVGYNSAPGITGITATNASVCPRVIGLVDYNGSINTTTALTDWSSGNVPAAATSTDGVSLWCVGTGASPAAHGGVRYTTVGSNTSIQLNSGNPATFRSIIIVNDRLYFATSTAGTLVSIGTVGSGPGLPTTAPQTIAPLPGIPIANGRRPNQLLFVDLDPLVPGPDVLYYGDEEAQVGDGGLKKYSLVSGVWSSNGSIGSTASRYKGITGKVSGTTVTLYATRALSNDPERELVTITDNTGYNQNFSGSVPVVIATVPATMAIRGVALAPTAPCPAPSAPVVNNITFTTADISWPAVSGISGYQYAVITSIIPPSSGTAITGTSYNATGLTNGTQYYAHVRSSCGSNFSSWVTTPFNTIPQVCNAPTSINVTNITGYSVVVNWNAVGGASSYQYFISNNPLPPSVGNSISTNTYTASGLNVATTYYVHVRTVCSASYSPWISAPFMTACPSPLAALIQTNGTNANISWPVVNGAIDYQYAFTTSPTPPVSGTTTIIPGFTANGLSGVTTYYIHVRSNCGSIYSSWTTTSFKTSCYVPSPVVTTINANAGSAGIRWRKVSGAINYEYAIFTHPSPPPGSSASLTKDTALTLPGLHAGSKYWLHLRSRCGTNIVSDWVTIEFHASGIDVYPNPTRDKIRITIYGIINSSGMISLFDASGRTMGKVKFNGNTTEINLSGYAPGIYFLKYGNYEGFATRVVKL